MHINVYIKNNDSDIDIDFVAVKDDKIDFINCNSCMNTICVNDFGSFFSL